MDMVIYKSNFKDLYFTWPTHSGLRVKVKIRSITSQIVTIIRRWFKMTSNQIRYAELREAIQHNRNTEGIQTGTLGESIRHNVADEGIRMFTARSQDYTNRGQLEVSKGQLAVSGFDAATRRIEAGTKQGELGVHSRQADIQEGNLAVNQQQADTQARSVDESIRHNIKSEKQQDFRNVTEAVEVGGKTLKNVTGAASDVVKVVPGFKSLLKGGSK